MRSSGGKRGRRPGKRSISVPIAMRASIRARGAPRQWWMPWPKESAASLTGDVQGVGRPGSAGIAVGRRQREHHRAGRNRRPSDRRQFRPSGRGGRSAPARRSAATPRSRPSARVPAQQRKLVGVGQQREHPLPIRFTVVSWPATRAGSHRGRFVVGQLVSVLRPRSGRRSGRRRGSRAWCGRVAVKSTSAVAAAVASELNAPAATTGGVQARNSALSASGMPSSSQITPIGNG